MQLRSSLVKNSKILNDVILDKWIGFKLPLNRDYSGLNFVVTLSNGELLKGIFNKNNEARLPINSECDSATIKIENFKSLENDSINTSITETLLNKIIG
ncbi:hypothetical protein RHO13_03950 [Orbus wheelerorum]|uniref:hypothetical protein n=1 Tax=Orbus wheelerorum TaxID=3074111 RepID=UPI00370D4F10